MQIVWIWLMDSLYDLKWIRFKGFFLDLKITQVPFITHAKLVTFLENDLYLHLMRTRQSLKSVLQMSNNKLDILWVVITFSSLSPFAKDSLITARYFLKLLHALFAFAFLTTKISDIDLSTCIDFYDIPIFLEIWHSLNDSISI